MSLNSILTERQEVLSKIKNKELEIDNIYQNMRNISDSQLKPLTDEIKRMQDELDKLKISSGYIDLGKKVDSIKKDIEKNSKDSKMFVYKYLAQHILDSKKIYNKWSGLFNSDDESLKYKIEGVTKGKEKEFLEFVLSLDNNSLRSILWTTGYQYSEIGHDYPTFEVLKFGEKYPQFGVDAKFYFSISNYFFSTKIPEIDRDIYKRIDNFFK